MSATRIGRPDLMAAVARAQAAARPYLGVGLPQPEALPLRPLGPKYRAAALALAARELAAELAPLPRALQDIAYRVRERIQAAPESGDHVLLEDLQRLREHVVALALDVGRLERAAQHPTERS